MKLTFNVLIFVLAVTVIGSTGFAFALSVDSPRVQIESGISSEDIQCNENRVLVLRTNGSPACVKETTADNLGWEIIKTEFKTVTVPTVQSEVKQTTPIITTLDMSSPVEFVDDGREFPGYLQKAPAPMPMYDIIMDSMNDGVSVNSLGIATLSIQSHEKYSINPGVGLYAEDWMPTYIPEGYKLLYTSTGCYESGNCSLGIEFVPTTFVLHQNVTNYDLQFDKGFGIGVSISKTPIDEIEDIIENGREIKDSQTGNYGLGYVDYTRDGKTVLAYEGGNDLNFYRSVLSFAPDEFTSVHILSTYHTLEEIIPIFESIMK